MPTVGPTGGDTSTRDASAGHAAACGSARHDAAARAAAGDRDSTSRTTETAVPDAVASGPACICNFHGTAFRRRSIEGDCAATRCTRPIDAAAPCATRPHHGTAIVLVLAAE